MGRQPDGLRVGRKEAATMLGVTVRTIDLWTRNGTLSPICRKANTKCFEFRLVDIEMLHIARDEKNIDLVQVKALALQALATARAAERELMTLRELLGMEAHDMDRSEASVVHLYTEATKEPSRRQLLSIPWVKHWASTFFSVDETYMELAAQIMDTSEPWKPLFDLSSRILRLSLRLISEELTVSQPLAEAYRYLEAGRNHLRYVSYLHCRGRHGKNVAAQIFDSEHSAVNEIAHILRH